MTRVDQIVTYRLSPTDVERIESDRQENGLTGEGPKKGESFPMRITEDQGDTVNGSVALADGRNFQVESVPNGVGMGAWHIPEPPTDIAP